MKRSRNRRWTFFLDHISGPIVQAKCVNCHVEGGVSGHTRLILHPSSNPDHETLNLAVFKKFLADVEDRRLLRTYVQRLRRKLGDDAARPVYIFNQRQVGYRMPRENDP